LKQLDLEDVRREINTALAELIKVAQFKPGQIVVIGCSTSEVMGSSIGTSSSLEVANAILDGVLPLLEENNLYLAVQGCEHINRALVVEEECAERYGLEVVNVIPHLKAGGGLATAAHQRFRQPVMVEEIRAHAGIDIGDTLIGMHLRKVAVPVRSSIKTVGYAHLNMARTRPKLIGGARAKYADDIGK